MTPLSGAVGGAEGPPNSWHEAEKSSLTHGTCGVAEQGEREQQEGWAEEQRGGGEDTCDCDRGHGRREPRREQSRRGAAEWKVKRDGQHC